VRRQRSEPPRQAHILCLTAARMVVRVILPRKSPEHGPQFASREIRSLNPAEARALLDAYREDPLNAFVTVAIGCGFRLGEALGLQWEDADLDVRTLRVRRAVQRFGGDATERRPLLAERRRIQGALKAQSRTPAAADTRTRLAHELERARTALAAVKTSVQIAELKSASSRRTIAMPAIAMVRLRLHRTRQLQATARSRRTLARPWVRVCECGRDTTGAAERNPAFQSVAQVRKPARHAASRSPSFVRYVAPRPGGESSGRHGHAGPLSGLPDPYYSHVLPAVRRDAEARMDAILEG